jgi:peptidoglycan/xylan/chitin deacetylase (PgdA/CDA1 family)
MKVTIHRLARPLLILISFLFFSCGHSVDGNTATNGRASDGVDAGPNADLGAADQPKKATVAEILARPEVPILCYHRIRPWTSSDGRIARDNVIPPDLFRAHMKILADSGYQTIMPGQLLDYLEYGDLLPEKPVMITFDDGSLGQYEIGLPVLESHGFKGVFFIMTIATGKKGYMDAGQLKDLSERGHAIESHTWDHHRVLEYDSAAWKVQLAGSVSKLESITGKPVRYFAYPFGLWSPEAFPFLRSGGMRGAFILATRRDSTDPLMTIRRMNVPGYWNEKAMLQNMKRSFRD